MMTMAMMTNDDDDGNNDELLFPYLQQALRHCSVSMAAQTDVWRALILYEYGCLYTNRDNAPGPLLQSNTIGPHDQAWFVVEEGGFLSQYVMAAALWHPLLFLLLQASLHCSYAMFRMCPGELKQAFIHFRNVHGPNMNAAAAAAAAADNENNQQPQDAKEDDNNNNNAPAGTKTRTPAMTWSKLAFTWAWAIGLAANIEALREFATGKTPMEAIELLHRENKAEATVNAASTLTTPWC